MNLQKLGVVTITLIPVFFILFIIFYNDNNGVVREESNNMNQNQQTSFTSSLKNQDDYPVITRDEINELETEILKDGEGEEVSTGRTVTVHYRGWLASDGSIFDQSFNRGDEGFEFELGGPVIEGWNEGVVGMQVGEIRRLFIPSDLGYGEAGAGSDIPPNSDLIFDVELISFE